MRLAAVTALAIGISLFGAQVWAASRADLDTLRAAIGIERLLEIMREEGLEQSEELREDLFAGRGGPSWSAVVSRLYDVPTMESRFTAVFDEAMQDVEVAPLIAFFTSDTGRQIVQLELEARAALMRPGVEEAAHDAFERMERTDPERVSLLRDFAEINDLVEFNVMGAMNGSLAFMRGLSEGGGFEMSEADILADIWAREAEIRAETTDWIFAYLGMAYQPLEADQIRAYSELSATGAGQNLNRALFAGFDVMFNEISLALGRSASRFMVGEDL